MVRAEVPKDMPAQQSDFSISLASEEWPLPSKRSLALAEPLFRQDVC